jgi:DNA-binding GntR family transcriptional regulator
VRSLADQAYKLIEERIVMLEFAPGGVYTEQQISSVVTLGRTPVREAMLRLEQNMLLSVIPRQGIMIAPLDFEKEFLALELRTAVERLVVERAARLATEIERRRFTRIADEIDASAANEDVLTFTRLDDAFNELMFATARQPFATRVLAPLHSLSRRIGCLYYQDETGRRDKLIEAASVHSVLSRAIAGGDEAASLTALEALLQRSRRVYLELAENRPF